MFIDPTCEIMILKYMDTEYLRFWSEYDGKVETTVETTGQGRAWFVHDDSNPADELGVIIYLDENEMLTAYEFSGALPDFHPRSLRMGYALWRSIHDGLGALASTER